VTKWATKEVEGEEGEPYLIRGPLPPAAQRGKGDGGGAVKREAGGGGGGGAN
jgi:hypothetical protein